MSSSPCVGFWPISHAAGGLAVDWRLMPGKDEHDFQRILPHLSMEQRTWLSTNITKIHPEHPWIAQLA
jgi:hypothetical protein